MIIIHRLTMGLLLILLVVTYGVGLTAAVIVGAVAWTIKQTITYLDRE
jgi:hypothetical protein